MGNTYGDVRAKFIARMNRRDMDTTLADGFLQDAITRIQRNLRVPAMEKAVIINIDSTYTTNGGIFIPSDYLQLRRIMYNSEYALRKEDESVVLPLANSETGEPESFCRRGGLWVLAPTPEGPISFTGTTTAPTSIGSAVLHMTPPSDLVAATGFVAGSSAVDTTTPAAVLGTVKSFDASTVTLSANVSGAGVLTGDTITFTNYNSVRIDYYAEFSALIATSDENVLSDVASDLLLYGALSYACDHFSDKRGDKFEGRYMQIASDIQGMADDDELSGGAAVQPAFFYSDDLEGSF